MFWVTRPAAFSRGPEGRTVEWPSHVRAPHARRPALRGVPDQPRGHARAPGRDRRAAREGAGGRRREVRGPAPGARASSCPASASSCCSTATRRSSSCRPLAANGTEYEVGAAVVTGVGVVSGVECVVSANDPTVRGGATNPYTLTKTLRAMEIARREPPAALEPRGVGGADLGRQAEIFIPGGAVFKNLTQLSASRASRRSPSSSATPPRAAPTCPRCATTR